MPLVLDLRMKQLAYNVSFIRINKNLSYGLQEAPGENIYNHLLILSIIVRCVQKLLKSGLRVNSGRLSLPNYRGVAQSGRVSALGAESRWFESSRPDHTAARPF
jgi:hypothetical protein